MLYQNCVSTYLNIKLIMKNLCVIFLFVPLIGFGQTKEEINEYIINMSSEFNKNCPVEIDKYVTLLSTMGNSNMFMYNLQVSPNYFVDYEMTESSWLELETQQKKNTFCSDPSMKGFRDDLKLNVIWKYRDLSGRVIGNIKLNYLDCKQ